MVARFDPAAKTVTVLSIPRDLWVDIPGNVSDISGMNRINAAFDSGPDLLVQTIEQDLGIPINHYIVGELPGLLGHGQRTRRHHHGLPDGGQGRLHGLDVTTTGCQVVNGTTALQLVRSRHLYYMNSNGYWEYDGLSDFSRIQRQDAFFRAVLAKVNHVDHNPFAINSFIGAAVGNLTIDDTLSESDLLHIAEDFRGLSVVAPDHRDAAHDWLRHRRRGRRPQGGAALRAEHDRRVQSDRDHATRWHVAQIRQDHHHDVDDDGADAAAQPSERQRPQRIDGERHRAHHRGGADRTGLHDPSRPNRRAAPVTPPWA